MTLSPRTLVASVAALATVAVIAAGSSTVASTLPPDDGSTPDVGQASEQSSTAPYRLEMFMEASMMGMTIDGDTPLATGEVVGNQSHMTMDFGALLGDMIPEDQMPPELRGVDMSMEFVIDGTDFYLRAPFFAALAGQGGDDPAMAVFADLGDGWGYVDGTAVPGMTPGQLSGSMGIGGIDPAAMFELLSTAKGAESIGTMDIRGVSSTGIRAEVNLGDLMQAQGTPVPGGANAFGDATFPIEVWIDKDGFVRRMVMDMSGEAIAEATEASGQDIPTGVLDGMNMTMTMEMFDYNAADIAIEVPTEFVDITAEFAEMVPPQGG